MKITNHSDLPQAIVDAITNDPYTKGDAKMSVTGLMRPPRLAILEKEHESEIVEDAADRIWSLLGQSIHTILERANRVAIAERRLSIEVEGWKISGGMDVYEENGVLIDYKTTSVWKIIKGDMGEWEDQLNLYSVILRHHGHDVKKLQVIAILRDWSKMEATRDANYPQSQVVHVDIPLWAPEHAMRFMRERVILHKQASLSALPQCSKKERWARDDVYAVMKKDKARALKLFDNKEGADQYASAAGGYVELRPGKSVRCESYCRVVQFCEQYQKSLQVEEEAVG